MDFGSADCSRRCLAGSPRHERAFAPWFTIAAVWLASFTFSLSTLLFLNDHFGRLTPARQIARYGELPFKDFYDPGFFLTEMTSAGLQRLLGDNLLGEALLDSSFIATGAALIAWVSFRMSRSQAIAIAAALLALLAMPRAYDYDKFLFYPLGVLLCRRYVERDTTANLMLLAGGIGIAALFRYDNGVFLTCAACVTLVFHARQPAMLGRRLGLFAVALAVSTLPLLFIVYGSTGIGDAARQALTYGIREGRRTRLETWPTFHSVRLVAVGPPPPVVIDVRWRPSTDRSAREQAEARFHLQSGKPHGSTDTQTWSYELADTSSRNLVELLTDGRVDQTRGIDRDTFTVVSQGTLWTRLRRTVPLLRVEVFPDGSPSSSALAVLYYFVVAVPMVVIIAALRAKGENSWILGVATFGVLIAFFILRDPLGARIGGAIGPTAVLAVWIGGRILSAKPAWSFVRAAAAVVLVLVVASEGVAFEWSSALSRASRNLPRIPATLSALAASPPRTDYTPTPQISKIVAYLRECTRPDDRILATWFVPELYYFAQRPFAGGMVVTFGGHWSEPWYQRRIVDKLEVDRAPIVIEEAAEASDLSKVYPLVVEYIDSRYHKIGETNFGYSGVDAQRFTVLARNDRRPVSTHPIWLLPCFV